jgi:hypothetical protein
MFARTLEVQWKALRWPLAVLAVLAFALPQIWAGPASAAIQAWGDEMAARFWIRGGIENDAGGLFPFVAIAAGALVALGVWYRDHTGDHVLALSLPVSRTRYVLIKFAAGLVLLLPVAVAFYVGGLVAAAGLHLPDWLHARPGLLALRFLLAMAVVYGFMFALAAGTIPTALKTLTAIAVLAVVIPMLPLLLGPAAGGWLLRAAGAIYDVLYESVGPFAVLIGHWSLIGV